MAVVSLLIGVFIPVSVVVSVGSRRYLDLIPHSLLFRGRLILCSSSWHYRYVSWVPFFAWPSFSFCPLVWELFYFPRFYLPLGVFCLFLGFTHICWFLSAHHSLGSGISCLLWHVYLISLAVGVFAKGSRWYGSCWARLFIL